MKKGNKVIINSDALIDSQLTESKGKILELWEEPLRNSTHTPLVKILLNNGEIGIVGQHEIQII